MESFQNLAKLLLFENVSHCINTVIVIMKAIITILVLLRMVVTFSKLTNSLYLLYKARIKMNFVQVGLSKLLNISTPHG